MGTFPAKQEKTAHKNEEDRTWERERALALSVPEVAYPILPVVWFYKPGSSGPQVSLLALAGFNWVHVTHSQKNLDQYNQEKGLKKQTTKNHDIKNLKK